MTTRQTRPDLPFYLSTEDLRFLLRKPSLDAVYKWIRRRKIMVFHDQRTIYVPLPELERVCPAFVHGRVPSGHGPAGAAAQRVRKAR